MEIRHRALLIVAAVMILLFGIGGWFGMRTDSEEPRTHVMAFDSTTIILIQFTDLADPRNNFQLTRSDKSWERISDRKIGTSPRSQASDLLRQFHSIPVKRDMGMIALVGERFDLTPSTKARITFIQADGITHELDLGSTTFAPGKVGVWTYVNVPQEKIVYAVEGSLTANLRPGAEDI